jgi:hypothetical protein
MKTISLRTLVRETLKVKRITRAGKSVQVTETANRFGFSNLPTARTPTKRNVAER